VCLCRKENKDGACKVITTMTDVSPNGSPLGRLSLAVRKIIEHPVQSIDFG
jgi:hypothetical protein